MAVTKLCEKCDKAVTILGYLEAQSLHSGGQFVCASCRRKDAAVRTASGAAGATR